MSEVLVLNRNYFAVHVADWQRVMTLLFQGHAQVVDQNYATYDFEEWKELSAAMVETPTGFVHTSSYKIAIPDVIALTFYDHLPRTEVRFTRKNLYHHYAHKCCYCGGRFPSEELNLDHVKPRAQGGTTAWENIVLSCIPCNTRKADKTPVQAGLKMHYPPTKPQWKPSYAIRLGGEVKVKASWQHFIDKAYWNTDLDKNA